MFVDTELFIKLWAFLSTLITHLYAILRTRSFQHTSLISTTQSTTCWTEGGKISLCDIIMVNVLKFEHFLS